MNRELRFKYYFEDRPPVEASIANIETQMLADVLYGENPNSLIARCQYTGLKDKNGTPIYGGDILKKEHDYYGDILYIVRWQQDTFQFRIKSIGVFGGAMCLKSQVEEVELIGNKFEDKHLLE